MNNEITLSGSEALSFSYWIKSHIKTCREVDQSFEGTIVNDIGLLKISLLSKDNSLFVCCACGESEEITDYSI